MPLRRAVLAASAAALLAACAAPEVRLSYPMPKTPQQEAIAKALSQAFLAFTQPTDGMREFAVSFDQVLAARGGAVLAYAFSPSEQDALASSLAPSSVIRISFEPISVVRSESTKEVKSKDSQGKETVAKVPFVKRTGRLQVQLALAGAADLPAIGRSVSVEFTEERKKDSAERTDDAAWLRKAQPRLMRSAGKKAAASLPVAGLVQRSRPVFVDDKDPVSAQARDHAFKGAWEAASALWASRLEEGRGGWKDVWDLALAAESRRVYPEAERLYRKAQEKSAGDPEAAALKFDEVIADISAASRFMGRSEAAAEYFSRPTAVMPFSDETTSIDGPANLRTMVAQSLTEGGWAVIPSDEVDAALRRHGFSQGGQLKKTTPAKLAAWTDAERVLFGDISEFRNIMLGAVGRRLVAGSVRIWDATARSDSYSSEKKVETVEAAGPKDAAGRLSAQLGKALIENLRHKPLAEESETWVERVLQGLPLRPPPRR